MGLKPCARVSEEHRARARKLRELAIVAPSRSEQARLNARAEMFDAFARLREPISHEVVRKNSER